MYWINQVKRGFVVFVRSSTNDRGFCGTKFHTMKDLVISAAAWLAVAGCGPGAKIAPIEIKSIAPSVLPVAPPFARPGERMAFTLQLQSVDVASFVIDVGARTEFESKDSIVVQTNVQSLGIAALITKVDEVYTSWIDTKTGRPLLFRAHEASGKDGQSGIDHSDALFTQRGAGVLPFSLTRHSGDVLAETQVIRSDDLWDLNTFFLVIRGWVGAIGSSVSSDIVRSRYMWRTQMQLVGKEKKATALGEFPTLHFEGLARALKRDGSEELGDDRHFAVWITDDADRVPVLIVAKTDFGDVIMRIDEYIPGTGARLSDGSVVSR
jgi:Protein of unknown function (DUF3108)